jgi:ribonuclease P protein component
LKKYGLSAFEKIKSRKDFESIFTGGETTYSSNNKIRANYKFSTAHDSGGAMFAVAVSKKLGNAVWRNRIKRLIREAYRFNKIGLIEKCKAKNVLLEIIFSPQALSQIKNQRIGLSEIEPPIKEIITKIKEKL